VGTVARGKVSILPCLPLTSNFASATTFLLVQSLGTRYYSFNRGPLHLLSRYEVHKHASYSIGPIEAPSIIQIEDLYFPLKI